MRKFIFILLFSILSLPSAVRAQEATIKISPPMKLSEERLSATTAVIPATNRLTSSRRATSVTVANQEPRDSGWQPNGTGDNNGYITATTGGQQDSSSFIATQSVSKVLINPDQFWTRKDRPVMDSRQHNLFGDPNCACDEWAGFCGCCGLKSSAGHLGQKWLSSGEPCECIENCCPNNGCGRCQKCR